VRSPLAPFLAAALLAGAAGAGAEPAGDKAPPRPLLEETLERARSLVDVPWSDGAGGEKGIIRIERTFYRGQRPCRDFLWTRESAGGDKVETRGTGCRVGKARWEIEDKPATAAAAASGGSPPPAPVAGAGDAAGARQPEPPRPARKPPALVFTMPPRSDL
jgi:surface antigen